MSVWRGIGLRREIKIIFHFIFLLLMVNISIAQEKEFWNSVDKTILALNLPQVSHTSQNSGFSINYNYPGFMSVMGGEIGLIYKNDNSDSYSFSLGVFHILFGYNKIVYSYNNSSFYANLSLGTFGKGNLGRGGISYIVRENNKSFELALNTFFHDGVGGGGQFIPLTNAKFHMRGIQLNVVYAINIFNSTILSFSSGVSYTQYKYVEEEDYYKFVSKDEANSLDFIGEPKWDSYWMIPIGITISYHF